MMWHLSNGGYESVTFVLLLTWKYTFVLLLTWKYKLVLSFYRKYTFVFLSTRKFTSSLLAWQHAYCVLRFKKTGCLKIIVLYCLFNIFTNTQALFCIIIHLKIHFCIIYIHPLRVDGSIHFHIHHFIHPWGWMK